jgi:hypothetical protein
LLPAFAFGTVKPIVAILLALSLLGSSAAAAQVPAAQEVPAEAATSISPRRSTVMEIPANQDVRRIASDGAVVTSRWKIFEGEDPNYHLAEGTVTFTLHDPERGDSTTLPFRPSVPQSEYERVTEVRVDGPYVSFTDVRDPGFAVYNRKTGKVRRFEHPEGGRIIHVSVSPNTGDVLYGRRKPPPPLTSAQTYLWQKGEDRPILISDPGAKPRWAPGGDLLLLKRELSNGGADGDNGYYWWIYSSDGTPLLDLSKYGEAGQADWSPDSEKIALEVRSEPLGLFILYLGGDGPSVEVERARYIAPPEEKYLSAPQWSPDGTKLAYTAWQIGAQSGEYTELRLLEDGSYRRYSAGPGSASTFVADPWTWTSPSVLTVTGDATSHGPGPAGREITRITIDF